MTTIHLTGTEPLIKRIASHVGYSGRKFRLNTTETVDCAQSGVWCEGSRSTFAVLRLDTFEALALHDVAYQFGNKPELQKPVALAPGLVCVEHRIFCGKSAGLTIHVHPQGLDPRLMPENIAISTDERIVLYATRSLKSSYNGIKDFRFYEAREKTSITRERWDAAKASLISCKLLNKAGAITPKGRNAVGQSFQWPQEERDDPR
jgi:hypothetical protein